MYTTIRGLYDNGKIVLYEQPPISSPTEVLVTFTKEVDLLSETTLKKERKAGFAKGTILYMSTDFDEPIDDHFDVFSE